MEDALEKILNDNQSGSTDLLLKLISYFSVSPAKLKDVELLARIEKRFSPFQAIADFLNRAKTFNSSDEKEILDFLNKEKEKIFKEINLLFEKSFAIFSNVKSIVTISNSFFLRNFILLLNSKIDSLSVSVSESRPQFEGRILAESFAEKGMIINLFTEAQTPQIVEKVDAVLLGADKVLEDGSVVNKVGSRNLAIVAKYFNKPVYVLVSKSKFSDSDNFDEGMHEPNEIYDNIENKLIRVTNNYFERVEPFLVTDILHI